MSPKQSYVAFAQPISQLVLIAIVVIAIHPVHADLQGEVYVAAAILAFMLAVDAWFTAHTMLRLDATEFRRLLMQETGCQVLAVLFVLVGGLCAAVTLIAHTTTGPMFCLVLISLLSAAYNICRAATARWGIAEMIDEATCFFRAP